MTNEHSRSRPFEEQGRRLRDARRKTGLAQHDFAPLVKTTRRHVIRLENGEHAPGSVILGLWAEVTDTPAEEFGYSDDEDESHLTLVADLLAVLSNRERIVAADRLIQSVSADGDVAGLLAGASGTLGLALRRQLDQELVVAFSREVAS